MKKRYTVAVDVTPQMAAKWLECNVINRPFRIRYCEWLCDEITSGRFRHTHQGIAINTDDNLQDGQHRLAAIIATGETVTLDVTYNAPVENFSSIDRGLTRSLADLCGKPKSVVGMVTYLHRFVTSKRGFRQTYSAVSPYIEAFEANANTLISECSLTYRRLSATPVRAAALLCMCDRNRDFVLSYYRPFVYEQLNSLTLCQQVFYKWLVSLRSLGGHSINEECFLRGLIAFDPKFADKERILIRFEDYKKRAVVRIRTLVGEVE